MKETLINNFLRISKIPRLSGEEQKIADFFVEVAKQNNLYVYKDIYNNVIIKKKGTKEGETLGLQAHLDMVGVKTKESNHDFHKDGIEVVIEEDKITAKNTSLGADQGIGLAMILTILEDKTLLHPDLEILLTVEEETTFNGAVSFPYDKIECKRMINLDNCRDNSVFIGASGDVCNQYIFEGKQIQARTPGYKIVFSIPDGGNSGENVKLSKENAITRLVSFLDNKDILISSIQGGTSENDIATSCEIFINTTEDVRTIFKGIDVSITSSKHTTCFDKEGTKNIINEILSLNSGYISENGASANLGLIKTDGNKIMIFYVFRSMHKKELVEIDKRTKDLNNGFSVEEVYTDNVWAIDEDSKILEVYRKIYFERYKEYPISQVWEGGMECSVFKNKIPGLDIISLGCTIEKFHTVDEVTYISSFLKSYTLLLEFLKTI